MDWGGRVTALGTAALKERTVTFGIKDTDRTRHLYILGRVGSGRGEIVTTMCLQDIGRGLGAVILDASGKVAPALVERMDPGASDRIIFLDAANAEYPYSWNPVDDIRALPDTERLTRLTDLLTSIYRVETKPITDMLAPLLLAKGGTLVSVYLVVVEERIRKEFFGDEGEQKKFEEFLKTVPDSVKAMEEHGRYVARDTLVRNLLGQKESKFTLGKIAAGAIVIVDFSRIRMFPTRMTPLVRSFVEATRAAAHASATPIPLYLQDTLRYLGETEIERTMTDPHLAITIADTVIQEVDRERREKALAHSGSTIALATHPADRALVERALYPLVKPEDVESLAKGEMVALLTIDGVRGKPFFASMLPLIERKNVSYQDIIGTSRERYATARSKVDALYRPPKKEVPPADKPPGFSDTFRSIFAKRADAAVAPAAPAPAPQAPDTTVAAPAPTNSDPPQKSTPGEIPEADLRTLLYVKPVAV